MKTQTKPLLEILTKLRRVFTGRSTHPSCSLVRLNAGHGKLTISANNFDVYSECVLDAEADDVFDASVSGERLFNAVKASVGELMMLVDDKSLHYQCGSIKMRLGISTEPPVEIRQVGETNSVTVESGDLHSALESVIDFVSIEQSRPTLNGVNFVADDYLRLVATDGRILSTTEISSECKGINAIVPTATCWMLLKMGGSITLAFADNTMTAESDAGKIVSALVEGNYPSWKSCMPAKKELHIAITVDREEMLAALPFVSSLNTVAGGKFIRCEAVNESITVSARSDETEGEQSVTAEVKGNIAPFCFDAQYMSTMLSAFKSKDVTFLMRDPRSPLMIESVATRAILQLVRVQ